MANRADYSEAKDVQNFIQEKVNQDAFLEWCRKPEVKQPISITGLPSRLYKREMVHPIFEKWWITGLLP